MTRNAALALWLALFSSSAAAAPLEASDSCGAPRPHGAPTADYEAVFERCRGSGEVERLATRRWRSEGRAMLLLVDPQTLATQVAPAQCWRCAATTDAEEASTRFEKAVQGPQPEPDTPKVLTNAGLLHGKGDGVFVTGDLCPSRRPLDRGFLEVLAKEEPGAPVALSVSGLWMTHHAADLDWLEEQVASGALAITWVNHSYSHPYVKSLPDARNYLLTPGVDLDEEIFKTERLMLENGLTPSVFFRFPGLVSDPSLMERLRRRHLVALGADSWIALGPRPKPGSIVLVHPNGNEAAGLAIFQRLLAHGQMPKPFRRLEEAP
jgi:hypothetical protein